MVEKWWGIKHRIVIYSLRFEAHGGDSFRRWEEATSFETDREVLPPYHTCYDILQIFHR